MNTRDNGGPALTDAMLMIDPLVPRSSISLPITWQASLTPRKLTFRIRSPFFLADVEKRRQGTPTPAPLIRIFACLS